MASSKSALLLSLAAFVLYFYSAYFMNYDPGLKKMQHLMPIKAYGLFKFLTYQCLIIQTINALLHVLAHFVSALEGTRDRVFTCLAYPVGSIVVYTFWVVWHVLGREFIFPVELDELYPNWLNHSTHTVIVPINLLLSFLVHHRHTPYGFLYTLGYTATYTAFLHLIKYQTNMYVYKYLDAMSDNQRLIYFACTGVLAYSLYRSGEFLTNTVHRKHSAAVQRAGSRKQKQK